VAEAALPWLAGAADGLATGNLAASVSVWRDGALVLRRASGRRNDGTAVDGETRFVIASVSKLFTSLAVARLVEQSLIDPAAPVPWAAMGIAHDPAWDTVTTRELLDHTSGMPVARKAWLDLPGPCSIPLAEVMAAPPTDTRGDWRYSNGNYCALGLLIEHVTGLPLDVATTQLVFAPAGVIGPSVSSAGAPADMAPYPLGVGRLDRLGGAGMWLASSDDVAAVVASITDADRATMTYPAVMTDQYGWGHTGTVDGAKACAWRFADGTVVAGLVAGNQPSTGGGVCDRLVTALAVDLGLLRGEPLRLPR
jgi:D-alanyl-D-alanine carboxypeptidase